MLQAVAVAVLLILLPSHTGLPADPHPSNKAQPGGHLSTLNLRRAPVSAELGASMLPRHHPARRYFRVSIDKPQVPRSHRVPPRASTSLATVWSSCVLTKIVLFSMVTSPVAISDHVTSLAPAHACIFACATAKARVSPAPLASHPPPWPVTRTPCITPAPLASHPPPCIPSAPLHLARPLVCSLTSTPPAPASQSTPPRPRSAPLCR